MHARELIAILQKRSHIGVVNVYEVGFVVPTVFVNVYETRVRDFYPHAAGVVKKKRYSKTTEAFQERTAETAV